jgi:polysaccharide biosynthesis/export protein
MSKKLIQVGCYMRLLILLVAGLLVAELLLVNPAQAAKSGYRLSPGNADAVTEGTATASDNCFADEVEADSSDYQLNAGDALRISVWREPDLLQELPVRPDGGITFPLIGDVMLAGLSVKAAEETMRGRLSKYIPDARVTITLLSASGNAAYVIGKVARPGPVPLTGSVTVVQALSVAGGATVYADTDEIRVLRKCEGAQRTFVVNYSDIEQGTNLGQNISLRSGDVVVVP